MAQQQLQYMLIMDLCQLVQQDLSKNVQWELQIMLYC
jgi:hypothetical protein